MKTLAVTCASALLALHAPQALALSSCSSDGTPRPVALFERFVSADCEACWADAATPAPGASEAATLVLDWIVPGRLGDDAPLSAGATRDALERLQALGRTSDITTDIHTTPVEPQRSRLRVAMGLAFNDYVGTSIRWTGARADGAAPHQFWLALVEHIPAGSEGSPRARNLVRNTFQGIWSKREKLSKSEQLTSMEMRPMRIPDGARPERLRMIGWVQDAQGQVVAAAQSACRTTP